MDSTDNVFSALDAIDTVAFKVGLKGYNVDEVDEFLERLSGEARQLKDQLVQQRQQLRQAAGRIDQLEGGRAPLAAVAPPAAVPEVAPAPAPAPRAVSPVVGAERVTSMIAMAQQFIEHAQQEAEAKARELTVAAQERAREIVTEARSRAEDEVNRLNGLKQRLGEDVDKLARQLELERTRLGAALSEFSRWVESTLRVGGGRPSSSPSASVAPLTSATATATTRPATPPPAPPPDADATTIGQVLRLDGSGDERS
jgi:DivIVA domain-containing protein